VIEKDVTPVVLASAEQIAEVTKLLDQVKLPDGTVDKWFSKWGVDGFTEVDTETVAKCIGYLNSLKEKFVP
jgi:hypothetical protein